MADIDAPLAWRMQQDGYLMQINQLRDENTKLRRENKELRELAQRLLTEYRYIRVRPRRMYLEHEARMRAIEDEMQALGIEVDKWMA